MNPVFMFSGQGAQKPGMGESLFDVPEAKAVLDCASDVLGYDVAELITSAPAEKLNDTRYAQPATCALSVGIASALQARDVQPQAVLGFSLGQVSALAVSGMLTYEETFSFVAERARLMAQAAAERPGVMSALLKADGESVAQLCEECAQGHLTHPVRFEQSVQALADQGTSVFAEVGFGGVLSNLVKRIDRKAARPCIQDAASFDAFVSEYAEDKE